jgi:hypothetical protein
MFGFVKKASFGYVVAVDFCSLFFESCFSPPSSSS